MNSMQREDVIWVAVLIGAGGFLMAYPSLTMDTTLKSIDGLSKEDTLNYIFKSVSWSLFEIAMGMMVAGMGIGYGVRAFLQEKKAITV